MLVALPTYLYFQALLDPTTIRNPGPGDGFVVLLYLVILLPTALVYSLFSFFTRTRPDRKPNPKSI
jgi:hypothetical protein